jgi:dihydrofolate synthase / folylpolyglutamate synthase
VGQLHSLLNHGEFGEILIETGRPTVGQNQLGNGSTATRVREAEGLGYLSTLEPWRGQGEFSLSPIRSILLNVGDPQDKIRSIHVAGTNGKGSVSVSVASILGAAGYKVGLTTSPHFSRINERIVIDGIPVSDEVIDFAALKLKTAAEKAGVVPSFFEGITACAFIIFEAAKVDWMVVEVGLGGRLDATNVIAKPEVAVITSIGLDHQEILGSTTHEIAREKAGIAKRGVPLVIGILDEAAGREVEARALDVGAIISSLGKDFTAEENGTRVVFRDNLSVQPIEYSPALNGTHQLRNSAIAVKVAVQLGISPSAIKQGLAQVFWPGRLEWIQCPRPILLDAAHNPSGVNELKEYLLKEGLCPIDLAFGALTSKDWKGMVDLMRPIAKNWILLEPDSSLAVPAIQLGEYLSGFGISYEVYGRNYMKFIKEKCLARTSEQLAIFGSIYLLGKIRSGLVSETRPLWLRKIDQ